MKNPCITFTNIVRSLYHRLGGYVQACQTYRKWVRAGKPVPPPHLVKQRTVKEFARRHKLRTMVETGTHNGDMVAAVADVFDQIYSIELGAELLGQGSTAI